MGGTTLAYKNYCRTVILAATLALTSACSITGPMDKPWDPDFSRGDTLFDQIPAWDDAAARLCGGHLPKHKRQPNQTDRC